MGVPDRYQNPLSPKVWPLVPSVETVLESLQPISRHLAQDGEGRGNEYLPVGSHLRLPSFLGWAYTTH